MIRFHIGRAANLSLGNTGHLRISHRLNLARQTLYHTSQIGSFASWLSDSASVATPDIKNSSDIVWNAEKKKIRKMVRPRVVGLKYVVQWSWMDSGQKKSLVFTLQVIEAPWSYRERKERASKKNALLSCSGRNWWSPRDPFHRWENIDCGEELQQTIW